MGGVIDQYYSATCRDRTGYQLWVVLQADNIQLDSIPSLTMKTYIFSPMAIVCIIDNDGNINYFRVQEIMTDSQKEAGRIPRTIDIELTRDLGTSTLCICMLQFKGLCRARYTL